MKGFAIGRTIFGAAAKACLHGEITDKEAVSTMEERFSHFVEVWRRLRS
jgi:5-dehydro-2-deoxygluconokinase